MGCSILLRCLNVKVRLLSSESAPPDHYFLLHLLPFGTPVVPEEYSRQIRLSSNSFWSVIRCQSSFPLEGRQALLPSTALISHFGLELITRTLLNGTPHSFAVATATPLASSLQKIKLLEPCLTCLDNSGAVNDALAAEYTPPAAITP